MSPYIIAVIVEGYGDVQAVPVVLRRLLEHEPDVVVPRAIRAGRSTILNDVEFERYLRIAEASICERGKCGGILIVFDADKDCAAEFGPARENLASTVLPHRTCRAVLPVREFETWILGGMAEIETDDSDTLGAAKAKLKARHGKYSETADQARLISAADLDLLAKRSRSFRRLRKVADEFRVQASETAR